MKDVIVKGILWMGGASLLTQVVTWLSTIMVARILSPSDYGLMALAGTYISFADQVNEFGVGTALVQRKDLKNEDVKGILSISILIGLFMTILTFVLAPVLADFFNDQRLVWIVRFLSLTFLINGAKSVQRNLMVRDMRFSELATVESGSRILTSLGALALAYSGFGVWVLAVQFLLQNFIMLLWTFWYERQLPGRIDNMSRMKEIFLFGGGVTLSGAFYGVYRSFDPLIVGKLLGKIQLGHYSFAQTLADKPFDKILSVMTQVFFPVFSKVQDDVERMKSYWFSVIEKELFVFTPLFVGLIIISPELVHVVLGDKWAGVILPLQVFCVIAIFKYLVNRINLVYISLGFTRPQLYFILILCLVMPVSLYIGGLYFGMKGVLYSWLLVYPVIFMGYFIVFLRFWSLSVRKLFLIFLGPLVSTCAMFLSVAWFPFVKLEPILGLVLKGAISGCVYLLVTFMINRRVMYELFELLYTNDRKSPNI